MTIGKSQKLEALNRASKSLMDLYIFWGFDKEHMPESSKEIYDFCGVPMSVYIGLLTMVKMEYERGPSLNFDHAVITARSQFDENQESFFFKAAVLSQIIKTMTVAFAKSPNSYIGTRIAAISKWLAIESELTGADKIGWKAWD